MIEITKVIEWDMGHRVPNHSNKCRNPHGHRYRLEVTVTGAINTNKNAPDEGMILDFFELKEILKVSIHDKLDHRFVVADSDTLFTSFFTSHKDDFAFVVVPFVPTVENMLQWCVERVKESLNSGLHLSRARLYETSNSWADYHDPALWQK